MVGYVFILMLFSLAVQKLFILMKSYLFILSFMSLALGDISVKILLCGISEIFLPMFSSRTLIVSRLIFKSFIQKKFFYPPLIYFCVWCKLMVEFHFFARSYPDLPTPVVEEAVFTRVYASAPFVEY